MLCDAQEGREGRRGGREAQKEGDISIDTADSLCCTAEVQHCKAIILPIKNSFAHVHWIAVLLSKGENGTYIYFKNKVHKIIYTEN